MNFFTLVSTTNIAIIPHVIRHLVIKNMPSTIRPLCVQARKNGLWLWILPAVLTWLLLSPFHSGESASPWPKLALFCVCSCLFCFVLAIKTFSTRRERLYAWVFYTVASLGVSSTLLFMGCFWLGKARPLSEEQMQAQQRQAKKQAKAWVASRIVPRDSACDASMLDLGSYYTALLPGQFKENQSVVHYSQPGIQTWHGMRFDARGEVVLFDADIMGIPVHQKCSGIAFAHGASPAFRDKDGSPEFVAHFASGRVETIPLVFGKDMEWSHGLSRDGSVEPLINSVIWSERISKAGQHEPDVLFYVKKWTNPFPDDLVTTIDFVKPSAHFNSFLVAITVEPVKN